MNKPTILLLMLLLVGVYLLIPMISSPRLLALPSQVIAPDENPMSIEKVALGKMLFHDKRLSSNATVSCASCHNLMLGGEDNRGGSIGIDGKVGLRSAPTVWNAAFNKKQFWDGRVSSLEEQSTMPITNPDEMGQQTWHQVITRLANIPGYQRAFNKAELPLSKQGLSQAIASYERTLITPNSAFDQYINGDLLAMTEQQIRGMKLFIETGCNRCHGGATFNGLGAFQRFPIIEHSKYEQRFQFKQDKGRSLVTGNKKDDNFWKVPTLRNITLTAPYFHNGKVKALDLAVKIMAKLQLDKDLSDGQVIDIVAFLSALQGKRPQQAMPVLPY